MTIKKLALGVIGAVIISALTAVITIFGTQMLNKKGADTSMFTSKEKESEEVKKFIEVKNILVSVNSEMQEQHYMLIDLAFAATDDEGEKKINDMAPAIRGATVALISSMNYEELRALSMDAMRQKLQAEYTICFKKLHTATPFTDVIISKMVYQ